MHDQAAQLRALVQSPTQADFTRAHPPPRKIVVCGGKGGVGSTTAAVGLSVALARQGARVVLVDADMSQADVAAVCQIETRDTIADVLAGRRTVHEALHRGPAGVQVLPGVCPAAKVPDCSPAAQERLLRELDRLGRHADLVLVDAGSGLTHVLRRFWQTAEAVLLVTTPDRIAIIDAYAAIKVLSGDQEQLVQLIVNRADPDVAADVYQRICRACEQFLGRGIELAGHIADESRFEPFSFADSQHASVSDIEIIAGRILAAASQSDRRASMVGAAAA